jgi:endonuclease YncB( thermonuclease family)
LSPPRILRTLALLTGVCLSTPLLAGDIVGPATVVGGDIIDVQGTRIRLFGIDAPELDQTCHDDDGKLYRCGQKAADELSAFLAAKTVSCVPRDLDQSGRTVAICMAGGIDVADWLVRSGLALDWPESSRGKYVEAQKAAERSGDGMWGGQWVVPWRYRGCIRAGGRPAACSESAAGP